MSSPHNALTVALGITKKPNASLPPSTMGRFGGGAQSSPQSSPAPKPATPVASPAQPAMGAKASEDDAGFVTSDHLCGGCMNWTRDTGECSKVDGMMGAGDGCRKYFQSAGAGGGAEELTELAGIQPSPGSGSDPMAGLEAR